MIARLAVSFNKETKIGKTGETERITGEETGMEYQKI
jgi:hypothetical protein